MLLKVFHNTPKKKQRLSDEQRLGMAYKDIYSGPIGLLSLLGHSYNPWVICATEAKSRPSQVEDNDTWFSAEEDSDSDVEDDALVSTRPFLPFEMIDEVILLVADGQDLINIITALFLTRRYHAFLAGDDYLWKRLLRAHYPHYATWTPDQRLLPTLIGLLRSFPNRMERADHWGFCHDMERLSRAYPCPMSYSFMRAEKASGCRIVDWRLIKKMFDTECIRCDDNPNLRVPKDKWIINNLTNVVHSCESINSEWVTAFYVFLEKTFGEPVLEYYAHNHVMATVPGSRPAGGSGPHTQEEREQREHSISLYIQEVMSHKKYGLYRFACGRCARAILPCRDRQPEGCSQWHVGAYS